ncbi:unnamed protein product [Protopolystoma xenopodis]|uniref:Uncharacterized protein n=1 Tax=Protopolystoma xenopodis TaxID=117903 RepID=A0A3S4ZND4_9PLAT|nr:unnamed protein product [Protopolystoma xenopodis]
MHCHGTRARAACVQRPVVSTNVGIWFDLDPISQKPSLAGLPLAKMSYLSQETERGCVVPVIRGSGHGRSDTKQLLCCRLS